MIYTPRIQSIFPELPCVGLSYLFRIQHKSLNQNYFIFVNLIFYHIDLILVILTSHHLLIWSDFDFWLWIETVTSWKNMSKNFNLLQKIFWHFLPKNRTSVRRFVRLQSCIPLPDENTLLQIIVLKFWRWTAENDKRQEGQCWSSIFKVGLKRVSSSLDAPVVKPHLGSCQKVFLKSENLIP